MYTRIDDDPLYPRDLRPYGDDSSPTWPAQLSSQMKLSWCHLVIIIMVIGDWLSVLLKPPNFIPFYVMYPINAIQQERQNLMHHGTSWRKFFLFKFSYRCNIHIIVTCMHNLLQLSASGLCMLRINFYFCIPMPSRLDALLFIVASALRSSPLSHCPGDASLCWHLLFSLGGWLLCHHNFERKASPSCCWVVLLFVCCCCFFWGGGGMNCNGIIWRQSEITA